MPPKAFISYKRKRSTKGRSVKGYARKRSVKHTAYRKKAYRAKRSYKRSKRSHKGIPHTRVRTTGTYARPVLQSQLAARRLKIQLLQSFSAVTAIPCSTSTGAGALTTQFFCMNTVSPAAFSLTGGTAGAPGDNVVGLNSAIGTASSQHLPRGLTTNLFNYFQYGIVMGSSIRIKHERTSQAANAVDTPVLMALTPMTASDMVQLVTSSPTRPVYSTNVMVGTGVQAKWDTIINTPGTKTRTLSFINNLPGHVTLHDSKTYAWMNPEPAALGVAGSNIWDFTAAVGQRANGFNGWWALSWYIPAGFSAATDIPINVTIHQRWWVKGFDPIAAALIALEEETKEEEHLDFLKSTRPLPTRLTVDTGENKCDTTEDDLYDMLQRTSIATSERRESKAAAAPAAPPRTPPVPAKRRA